MTLPDFIVVGAAKAGTTALYWYLGDHPQVFMSRVKETNYFAYGLDEGGHLLYGDPELHHFPIRTIDAYERSFEGAGDARAVGEASPIYLECPQSAGRIRDTIPHARIICGLRDPVDRAYSDYLMYLRSRGRRLDAARELTPSAAWARPDSHWMQISMYHEALRRYFDVFPPERIYVFLFDDLKADQAGLVRDLYRFLGADDSFVPDFDTPHNVGGMPASMLLERVFTNDSLRRAVDPWIPKRAADWARRTRTRNLRRAPRLPNELAKELRERFRDDISKTAELIGRDLSLWLER
ncbi:MAG: sulfotransferase [Actinobacteria bacterium]|nr:MAG: sulfotransferase [Actinomycetota bacterium]